MKKLVHTILLYLNYALAVFLLLADVSVYISPAKIWLAAFFGLAFPYLVVLNFLFFIYWIARKNRAFMVSLIVLVLSINNISHTYQPPKSKTDELKRKVQVHSSKSLKVLSYNVQVFNLFGNNTFGEHQEKIFDYISGQEPDVICFQEFYVNETKSAGIEKISNYLKDYPHKHIVWVKSGEYSNYGIAIYSKHQLINKQYVDFPNSDNISIFCDVTMNSDTVRIFNNHLQSINFDNESYRFISNQRSYTRSEKLKEIQNISLQLRDAFIKRGIQAEFIADEIQASQYPVIICGDFNDTPVSYSYYRLRGNHKDAFLEAGSGFGSTYKGKFPSYRIDFILHSQSLETLSFRTDKIKLSDHYPIMAEIMYQN
ncbi:MAG: endonuclease/exonuclease/phosphatase family protein [Bacteroidales bacterium]